MNALIVESCCGISMKHALPEKDIRVVLTSLLNLEFTGIYNNFLLQFQQLNTGYD